MAFDTSFTETADPDLEIGSGWSGGNQSGPVTRNRSLIVQENDTGCLTDLVCNSPDDEGARPAGSFAFDLRNLDGVFNTFSCTLIDVESAVMEPGTLFLTAPGLAGLTTIARRRKGLPSASH